MMNNKVILGIFVAVVAVGLGAVGLIILSKQLESSSATTTEPVAVLPIQPPPPPIVPAPYASSTAGYVYENSYPSLDGRFSLNLYTYENPQVCRFRVMDTAGHKYDVDKLLGTDITSGCDPEEGNDFWHYFGGWVDGDKVVMPDGTGKVNIVDPENLTVETYQYDASNLYFTAVNRSQKYWLFLHDAGGGDYTLLDQNKNVVLSGLASYKNALYDKVNDGFVFTAVDQVSSSTDSLRLDFLPVNNLKLRNILTTDPFVPAQRDSVPPSLSSKPGEIMYSPGFGGLDLKYFGSDGAIHITL
jgi:hypothetical protein